MVVEKILSYLERSFTPADVVWSGQPHHLTFGQPGKAECALALLHLILERWLPTVEYDSFCFEVFNVDFGFRILATPEQLTRLLKVIMRIKIPLEPCNLEGQLRPEHLLLRTLHSAEFWELHIMRSLFVFRISPCLLIIFYRRISSIYWWNHCIPRQRLSWKVEIHTNSRHHFNIPTFAFLSSRIFHQNEPKWPCSKGIEGW